MTQKADPSLSSGVIVLFLQSYDSALFTQAEQSSKTSAPIFYFVFAVMVGANQFFKLFIDA